MEKSLEKINVNVEVLRLAKELWITLEDENFAIAMAAILEIMARLALFTAKGEIKRAQELIDVGTEYIKKGLREKGDKACS